MKAPTRKPWLVVALLAGGLTLVPLRLQREGLQREGLQREGLQREGLQHEAPNGAVMLGIRVDVATVQAQSAPPPPSAELESVVVARVGATLITAADLERRLEETPRATLAKFGATPEEIRRGVLEQVLVRDALFAEQAKAEKFDQRLEVRDRMNGVLRGAMIEALRAARPAPTDEDVKAFYDANRDKFSAPKRIAIHRILVASEDEAKELIKTFGSSPDPKTWNETCREKSLDQATNLRGGNIGLIDEHGSTAQQEHAVDPALFVAAEGVKDGEVVPKPVKEGGKFAVIWKRQSMRSMARPLELEAPAIRSQIVDQALRDSIKALLAGMRKEYLKEHNPELCDMISVTPQGDVEKARRPGVLPRAKRAASPVPIDGPGGLR